MIVLLDADGAVVTDADDCSSVSVESGLEPDGLRAALAATGLGAPSGPDVVLDVAVLRSRARLVAAGAGPEWEERFDAMLGAAGPHLTGDGRGLRLPVERVG